MNKKNDDLSVICEIASAHGGDAAVLREMLSAAHKADADWVKVQIYHFESLVAGDNEQFSVLKTIELQPSEWTEIVRFSESLQPRLIVEVFDMPSLELIAGESAVQAFKIPTADLGNKEFVDAICQLGKPIFIGVGGATFDEIDAIVEQVSTFPGVRLVLMHGIQSFPTKLEDSLLLKIPLFQQRYGCDIGFADHINAEDKELARVLPAMAISAGATVIEKHLTLDRSEKGFDYYSALNPDEFSDFVVFIRRISDAMGVVGLLELTDA